MSVRPAIELLEPRCLLQGVTFAPHGDYELGSDPQGLVVADFNGDGIPDIAAVNKGDSDVQITLGCGDGTFPFGHDYGTGYRPVAIAAGDLTGDGHPDIVTADSASDGVTVFLNNGDGTFGLRHDFPTGNIPESVALGDFNGDGIPDIVTANFGSNSVSILMGNGDGTFQAPITFAVGNGPRDVAVADLTGDGHMDIVTADLRSASVSILFGNGNGTFAAPVTLAAGNDPEAVAIGDLNGDGLPDLAVADSYDHAVSVLLNKGGGKFKAAKSLPLGNVLNAPDAITIADVNSDGKADIVTASTGLSYAIGQTVEILQGNGDGTFAPPLTEVVGYEPTGVAVADLNGDGKQDIVATDAYASTFSVLLANEPSAFAAPTYSRVGPTLNIVGSDGPDTIILSATGDTLSEVSDGVVHDFVIPTVDQIYVLAGQGDDSIRIGPGVPATTVIGGVGNDTIMAYNSADDKLVGKQGRDSISARHASGNDLLNGGRGADTLLAGGGGDTLNGQRNNDSLVGGSGSSVLDGSSGTNTVIANRGNAPDPGIDSINAGDGSDFILGGPSDLIINVGTDDTVTYGN